MTARTSHLLLWACTSGLFLSQCFADTDCYWGQAQSKTHNSLRSNESRTSPPGSGIPGFHGTATEALFQFSSEKLQERIGTGFERVSFPNVLSTWDIPVVGTVTLNLSSVLFSSTPHSARTAGIGPNAQGGIDLFVQFLTVHVACHFRFSKGIFPAFRGSADLDLKDSSIIYSFVPKANNNGNLFFVSQGEQPALVSIPAISVHTSHTPLAWLYNLFLSKFGSRINRIVTAEISRQIGEVLPNAVNKILAVDTLRPLGGLAIITALAGDPYVELNRITVVDWAQPRVWFKDPSFDCACVRTPSWQPPTWEGSKPPMLIADIDEIVVNCLLYAYDMYYALEAQFRSIDLQMTLQTNDWAKGVPNLPLMYPNASMIFQLLTGGDLLFFDITRDQGLVLHGSARFDFALDSKDPASLDKQLFSLGVDFDNIRARHIWLEARPLDLAPMLNIEFELMPGSISSVDLLSSAVGDVNTTGLQDNIEKLADSVVQNWVNGQLFKNVAGLPFIPFVHFVQPNLSFHEGWLSIATDIDYYVP